MAYSEQLERRAERDRADIEETLDELRARLRPGDLVDRFVDYARDGAGAQFYENLKKQIVDNPLPVTVIGAGLAWLAISNALPRRHDGHADNGYSGNGHWRTSSGDRLRDGETMMPRVGEHMAESARDAAEAFGGGYRSASDTAAAGYERVRSGVASTGASIREGASDLADKASDLSERASDMYGSATERAGELYGSARDAAGRAGERLSESMSRARRGMSDTGQRLADFSREQPLVVAALGVAIGAALGAALPSTEAESRVMGDAADSAKEKMRGMVDEHADRLKQAAHDVADRATEDVQETASSALDRMDRDSEQRVDEESRRGEGGSASDNDAEERFAAGDRPSNG